MCANGGQERGKVEPPITTLGRRSGAKTFICLHTKYTKVEALALWGKGMWGGGGGGGCRNEPGKKEMDEYT